MRGRPGARPRRRARQPGGSAAQAAQAPRARSAGPSGAGARGGRACRPAAQASAMLQQGARVRREVHLGQVGLELVGHAERQVLEERQVALAHRCTGQRGANRVGGQVCQGGGCTKRAGRPPARASRRARSRRCGGLLAPRAHPRCARGSPPGCPAAERPPAPRPAPPAPPPGPAAVDMEGQGREGGGVRQRDDHERRSCWQQDCAGAGPAAAAAPAQRRPAAAAASLALVRARWLTLHSAGPRAHLRRARPLHRRRLGAQLLQQPGHHAAQPVLAHVYAVRGGRGWVGGWVE